MKTIDKKQWLPWLRFSAMVALIVLSSYCCSPRRGFISTLALFPLACFVSAILYYSPKTVVLLSALCSFSFLLADGMGMTHSLLIAAFCALSAWLCALAAKQLARVFQTKRILSLLWALLLLLPPLFGQTLLFSTPWSNRSVQKQMEAYVKEKYPDQTFTEIRACYDPQDRSYEGLLFFSDGSEVVLEESLRWKDGILTEDNYFTRFCQKGLERRQSAFVSLIRSQYPNRRLWLDCSKTTLSPQDRTSFPGTYNSIPQWLKDSTALELGFQFSITDNQEFLALVKEYFAFLNANDFPYQQIRFYGGDQGIYLYTLTATPDTPPEELSSLIRSCYINMNIPSISLEYSYLY